MVNHVRADRIEHHIPSQFQQVGLAVHQDRLIATLEQVPGASMAAVAPLRIDPVQLPHALGQIAIDGLHHQVVVVGHQAVSVTAPVEALYHLTQDFEKPNPIGVVLLDRFAAITAGSDVVERAGEFDADGAGHDGGFPR